MKVDLSSLAASQISADRGTKQVAGGSLTGTQAPEDRISFHSGSLSVQSLTSQALTSPQIRQDKVDQLSQSVASGTYKPDASGTAGAMIEHDQK
ncbi:MAG: flagellar biosynthesis anti-sigma factor FlgM [Terracidiphilus sp.]|jgi:flagellar biosynthesis anti-sigma factor FlgM